MGIATEADGSTGLFRKGAGAKRLILNGILSFGAILAAIVICAANLGEFAIQSGNSGLARTTASFWPSSAAANAEIAYANGNIDSARSLSLVALANAPLSATALRTLGVAAAAQGRLIEAGYAMSLAGGLGWRDTPTQLWLLNAYATQGDYVSAMQRMDALLRRQKAVDVSLAVAMAAAFEPAARPALFERLSEHPPWRSLFFETAHKLTPAQFDRFEDYLHSVPRGVGELGPKDVEGFSTRLFEHGHYLRARHIWGHFGRSGDRALVFDGQFRQASLTDTHQSIFEWRFPQPPGSETEIGIGERGSEALHASSGGNARLVIAAQALALTPGRYTFSAWATAEPGTELQGYSWVIECLNGPQPSLPKENRVMLANQWTRISYDFDLPAGCKGQYLKLILRAGQPRPLSLWFDNVDIKRI